jgi:hypothetical protein
MSCSSPYVIPVVGTTLYTATYNVTYNGSITIPKETIDGVTLCIPTYNLPEYYCPSKSKKTCVLWDWDPKCKGKWWDWKCSDKCVEKVCKNPAYKDPSWGWGNCKKGNDIEIFPKLTITYSATIPMTFDAETGYVMSVNPPPPTGVQTASIEVQGFDLNMDINGTPVVINIKENVTFSAESNGTFSATVALTSVTVSTDISDLKYKIDFTLSLLFCAEPTNGMSWLNLQVDADLKVISDGETIFQQKFNVACPITDVD